LRKGQSFKNDVGDIYIGTVHIMFTNQLKSLDIRYEITKLLGFGKCLRLKVLRNLLLKFLNHIVLLSAMYALQVFHLWLIFDIDPLKFRLVKVCKNGKNFRFNLFFQKNSDVKHYCMFFSIFFCIWSTLQIFNEAEF
jgi:hypothetical protein